MSGAVHVAIHNSAVAPRWLHPSTGRLESFPADQTFDIHTSAGQERLAELLVDLGTNHARERGFTQDHIDFATSEVLSNLVNRTALHADGETGRLPSARFYHEVTALLEHARQTAAEHRTSTPFRLDVRDGPDVAIVQTQHGMRTGTRVQLVGSDGRGAWIDPETMGLRNVPPMGVMMDPRTRNGQKALAGTIVTALGDHYKLLSTDDRATHLTVASGQLQDTVLADVAETFLMGRPHYTTSLKTITSQLEVSASQLDAAKGLAAEI